MNKKCFQKEKAFKSYKEKSKEFTPITEKKPFNIIIAFTSVALVVAGGLITGSMLLSSKFLLILFLNKKNQ